MHHLSVPGLLTLALMSVQEAVRFHMVDSRTTWSEAQGHCRENFDDLATIQDAQDNTDVQQLVQSGKFWIGLYRPPWRWSEGDQVVHLDSWFDNWGTDEPGPGGCVGMCTHSRWKVRDCEEKHFSICYKHILVQELKTWSEAQRYCRDTHTDLSSVVNEQVNKLIGSKLSALQDIEGTSNDPLTWIGLHRDGWTWSEDNNSTYRHWAEKEPDLNDETKRLPDPGNHDDVTCVCDVIIPWRIPAACQRSWSGTGWCSWTLRCRQLDGTQ
uniref:Macrophage mannose receptor 1-like n=1 Tax=Cynoglossus semilaevis TaxID=244447 RepID=A0A3P8UMP2_CYNSE